MIQILQKLTLLILEFDFFNVVIQFNLLMLKYCIEVLITLSKDL